MREASSSPKGAAAAPGGIIYEPGERVLAVGRPFAWWKVFIFLGIVFLMLAVAARGLDLTALRYAADAGIVLMIVLAIVHYVRWVSHVWVLTDRRVIARSGILNRTQAAVLLERVQDASLTKPFLASMIADFGILHLETAGIHSEAARHGRPARDRDHRREHVLSGAHQRTDAQALTRHVALAVGQSLRQERIG